MRHGKSGNDAADAVGEGIRGHDRTARQFGLAALIALAGLATPVLQRAHPAMAAGLLADTSSGVVAAMDNNNHETAVNNVMQNECTYNVAFVQWAVWGNSDSRQPSNVPGCNAVHGYYVPWSRDPSHNYSTDLSWFQANHPDWILYKNDRTTIPQAFGDTMVPLDYTNPAVQDWILNTYVYPAIADGYNALCFDNGTLDNYLGAAGVYRNGSWVQLYSGNWSDSAYYSAQTTGMQSLVSKLKTKYPNVSVSLNQPYDSGSGWSQVFPYLDFVWDESGFTGYGNGFDTDSGWLSKANAFVNIQKNMGKAFMFATYLPNYSYGAVTPNLSNTDSTFRSELQWVLANYLLIKYSHTYFDATFNTANYEDQPELHTANNIGTATNDFYASQNVYMRDFTNGKAVVNPSSSATYTVTFPAGAYKDLYGNSITSYSMPPHSGLILLGSSTTSSSTSTPTPTPTSTSTSSSTAPALAATYNTTSQPKTFTAGQAVTFPVTVTNTGSSTWPSTGTNWVRLSVSFANQGGGYGTSGTESTWPAEVRVPLPNDVAPGQSVSLSVTITPPASGNYVLEDQLVKEYVAWFPQYSDTSVTTGTTAPSATPTPTSTPTSTAPALAATYNTTSQPTSFNAGQTVTFPVTVTNTGSMTWQYSGTNRVRLSVAFATRGGGYTVSGTESTWPTEVRVVLPYNVAPGQSVTLNVTITAPASGSYTLEDQLVEEYVSWFPQYSDTSVTVSTLITVPGAPTNVMASAKSGAATVSWAAPSSNGGSPITSYVVRAYAGTTLTVATTMTVPASSLSATVSGLQKNSYYTFTVQAVNAAGPGAQSARSTLTRIP